jgi:hypothetical protein
MALWFVRVSEGNFVIELLFFVLSFDPFFVPKGNGDEVLRDRTF